MNLKYYPRKTYAINQFHAPHSWELMGRKFYFSMDGGTDYELNITGETTLEWNTAGKRPVEAKYECIKSDDTTYLLDYDLTDTVGTDHATNHLFVIDLEQRLVTMAVCKAGQNRKYPFLVKTDYDFGAIVMDGFETPFRRHTFTSQMIGTRVEWHWSFEMWTQHFYYDTAWYTIAWPDESAAVQNIGAPFKILPSPDENSRYIKIKENMYLYCLTEEMMERMNPGSFIFRSNHMAFLQNYDRMCHSGRTFGHIMINGEPRPCRTLFGSFGRPIDFPMKIADTENAYTV